ncbi:MAG: spore coat U domain-containing protein [Rickettsiella sp.]|nr:spore coat U domain-containing protein [Rickettsiella sp.]
MSNISKVFVCFCILLLSRNLLAATVTGSLPVSATVISNCALGTIAPVAFGNYDPTSATANNNQGSINVICSNGTTYNIGLNPGTFSGATVTTRRMTGTPPGTPLSYSLYRDSGRTLNWGQTIGTDTLALTGTGVTQTSTVYGQIPALQTVTVGSYADTVTITVTF